MAARRRDLLTELATDALDRGEELTSVLRKRIALGGEHNSESLREWASRELKGYYGDFPLPEYRVVHGAPDGEG